MANWNPHVHAPVIDVCCDRQGNAYSLPVINAGDMHVLEQLFSAMVFRTLLEEEMISRELVEKMRSLKHSGFSVHRGEPIDDPDGRKTLAEYVSRAPFSLERMSLTEDTATVFYRGEHFHPTRSKSVDWLMVFTYVRCGSEIS